MMEGGELGEGGRERRGKRLIENNVPLLVFPPLPPLLLLLLLLLLILALAPFPLLVLNSSLPPLWTPLLLLIFTLSCLPPLLPSVPLTSTPRPPFSPLLPRLHEQGERKKEGGVVEGLILLLR